MKRLPALPLLLAGFLSPLKGQEVAPTVLVEIRTELGSFTAELYPASAPATVENFLWYVDQGFFDGGSFHRTVRADNQPNDSVRIAVIQGDIAATHRRERRPAIPLERTRDSGLSHLDGTLSMARAGPDTATSSFFICVGPQPELDFGGSRNPDGQGFAAFGRVVAGMDVVRAIQERPAEGQQLSPAIRILGIRRSG